MGSDRRKWWLKKLKRKKTTKKKIVFTFLIVASIVLLVFVIAKPADFEPDRAFYFWENNRTSLTPYESETLKKLNIKKLYLKFFEVEKNEVRGIIPAAKSELKINDSHFKNLAIVPTVYIRNNVFKKTSKEELKTLAKNLYSLIKKRFTENFSPLQSSFLEIQIDCDWTESTKENYFLFLQYLNQETPQIISATLRLYAYKFPNKMGVLPVDRAMLMCYNLLSPKDAGNRNSILDLEELQKYIIGAKKYPHPLDIAIPIYSSVHFYQNDKFKAMLNDEDEKFKQKIKPIKGLWFTMKQDTVINGIYIRKGDRIKYEINTSKKINKAIDIIKSNVIFDRTTTIAIYHLQEVELKQYRYEELASFYTHFH